MFWTSALSRVDFRVAEVAGIRLFPVSSRIRQNSVLSMIPRSLASPATAITLAYNVAKALVRIHDRHQMLFYFVNQAADGSIHGG